jgi:cytochrome c oxidase cbb3-type subunit 3
MAQVASFIKSLHGTNPHGAKQAEGQLYKEEPVTKTDSAKVTTDTLKAKGK